MIFLHVQLYIDWPVLAGSLPTDPAPAGHNLNPTVPGMQVNSSILRGVDSQMSSLHLSGGTSPWSSTEFWSPGAACFSGE